MEESGGRQREVGSKTGMKDDKVEAASLCYCDIHVSL